MNRTGSLRTPPLQLLTGLAAVAVALTSTTSATTTQEQARSSPEFIKAHYGQVTPMKEWQKRLQEKWAETHLEPGQTKRVGFIQVTLTTGALEGAPGAPASLGRLEFKSEKHLITRDITAGEPEPYFAVGLQNTWIRATPKFATAPAAPLTAAQIEHYNKTVEAVGKLVAKPILSKPANPPQLILERVVFSSIQTPTFIETSAAPLRNAMNGMPLALSYYLPSRIDDWSLELSPEPVLHGDGNRYFQVQARNEVNGVRVQAAAVNRGTLNFGRYTITVDHVFEQTRTIEVHLTTDSDPTPRGVGSYVRKLPDPQERESWASYFQRLGNTYGFQVQWADHETTIVQRAMELNRHGTGEKEGMLLDWLAMRYGHSLQFEEAATSQLLVRLKEPGRDLVLKQAELQEMQAIFRKDFQPTVRVYKVTDVSAGTAQTLINRELGAYVLATDPPNANLRDFTVAVSGKYHGIGKLHSDYASLSKDRQFHAVSEETSVADEKSGSVIVSAAAPTHAKIEQLLNQTEALVNAQAPADRPSTGSATTRRFRVEMTLLEGGAAGEVADPETSATYDAAVPAQYGIAPADLKVFGFDAAVVIGKGVVTLIGEAGLGQVRLRMGNIYSGDLTYKDYRAPYLVAGANIHSAQHNGNLIENTVFLEPDKPAVLGVTNLKRAVILVLRLVE